MSLPAAASLPLRRRVEASFAQGLREELLALGWAGDRLPVLEGGGASAPTDFFLVVMCLKSEEITSGAGAFRVDLRLTLCCPVGTHTSDEHDTLVATASAALERMPRQAKGCGVIFDGWQIVEERQAMEEQTHGDIWFLVGGVRPVSHETRDTRLKDTRRKTCQGEGMHGC